MRFELGTIVATAGVNTFLADDPHRGGQAIACLGRHAQGDWGTVCEEDASLNTQAIASGDRLLSAYEIDGRKIWIITEADRSATTLLFPEEY